MSPASEDVFPLNALLRHSFVWYLGNQKHTSPDDGDLLDKLCVLLSLDSPQCHNLRHPGVSSICDIKNEMCDDNSMALSL